MIAIVAALSTLLWLPFVRRLTGAIRQMTAAAEQIAEERFDVRVDEQRSTEWMRFDSLASALDPNDSGRTVEGWPAPERALLLAEA